MLIYSLDAALPKFKSLANNVAVRKKIMNQPHQASTSGALALGALGVVFGDIGTSPLYTLKEVFGGHHLALSQDNVLGILSLVFWELILVVSVKYVGLMMRADNKGEGGILALLALAQGQAPLGSRIRWFLMSLGFLGASFFFAITARASAQVR